MSHNLTHIYTQPSILPKHLDVGAPIHVDETPDWYWVRAIDRNEQGEIIHIAVEKD